MTEIIRSSLAWAPESAGELPDSHPVAGGQRLHALRLCLGPGQTSIAELYRVPHYSKQAIGRAFGPLAVDTVLRFCHNLDVLLKAGKVCLFTSAGDDDERTNCAVLVGAYLLLRLEWTIEQVARVLSAEADKKFVFSFAPVHQPAPQRNLSVTHCWEGLALARDRKWIDTACIPSEPAVDIACRRVQRILDTCDAAWLIPGRVLVCADPVTTALDPNPQTFATVFPVDSAPCPEVSEEQHTGKSWSTSSTVTPNTNNSPRSTSDADDEAEVASPLYDAAVEQEIRSSNSSCSFRRADPSPLGTQNEEHCFQRPRVHFVTDGGWSTEGADVDTAPRWPPKDWTSMLKDHNISMVVRTNMQQERGMVAPSYDRKRLNQHGIEHMDITLIDGGCPTKQDVCRMVNGCESVMDGFDNAAVLVHCKGGFGRSVIMACVLIIHQFDIPGSALLGWVRMARPGAINTLRQEKFLLSMRGRADIRRYMGGEATCGLGQQCSLQ